MTAVPLLLAAYIPKLRSLWDAPGSNEDNLAYLKLVLSVVALIALIYEASREAEGNPVPLRWRKLAGACFAVAGVVAYFQFFQIGYPKYYHRHEFFHYYMGAKYFKQIGFEGIYTCTAVAENELGFVKDPKTRKLRDLKKNLIVNATETLAHPETCKDAFTPEQWDDYKRDVTFFRNSSLGTYWTDMQQDHGYNPPPVWGIAGWFFSKLNPASEAYLQMLSGIDIGLFAGMFGFVYWAFGWRVGCLALLFFGTQAASPFYWTGGAFLRQDWLFYAIVSACLVRKKKYVWGGAFLMTATLLRVFPLFFFGGWMVVAAAYFARHRKMHPAHVRLAAGAIAAACTLVPVSAAVHGVRAWPDFLHHISVHNSTPLTNHVGWKTVVAHSATGRMQVARDNKLTDPFEKWKNLRRDRLKHLKPIYYGGMALMLGMFVYACWRLHNLWVVQALGCLLATVMVELTCYYYSYFIYGAMLSKGRRPIEFALLFASALSELCALQYGYFDDRFTGMSVVFVNLSLFMVAMYMKRPGIRTAEVMTPAPVLEGVFSGPSSTPPPAQARVGAS